MLINKACSEVPIKPAATEACEQDGYPTPVWTLEPGGLWVTFAYPPDQADQVTGQVTGQVTPPVTPPVTALLNVLAREGALGNAQIRAHLQLKDRAHLRTHYLDPALAQGWIEQTLPDKPTSRLQKYRLTAAGQRLQAALRPGQAAQQAGKGGAP